MTIKLDNINQSILLSLQEDARVPIAYIAESAGISTSPCPKRIKQFEGQSVVTNYVANINLQKFVEALRF